MDTRPLPSGWVSQWDASAERFFFVDTTKNPPVSTWNDPRNSPYSDAPPPYSPSEESTNKMPSMPMAMPTPASYQPISYNNDNLASSTYPSDSKDSNNNTQPDSSSYNKYDDDATSKSAAASTSSKKKGGFLSKLKLGGSSSSKPHKPPKPPIPALGTAATLGAFSHHKPSHRRNHGIGMGSGLGLGLGGTAAGLLVGGALFSHKGFGFGGDGFGGGGCGNWDCGW